MSVIGEIPVSLEVNYFEYYFFSRSLLVKDVYNFISLRIY